jgi:hypothetical protein
MNTPINFAALGAAMAQAISDGNQEEVNRIKDVMHSLQPWRQEVPSLQDLLSE